MTKTVLRILLMLFCLPAVIRLHGQERRDSARTLQPVVVEAAPGFKADLPSPGLRLDQPLIRIPQNIQVVTGALLHDQQLVDLLESVTRNVSGAMRVDSWDNYANIIMRGARITPFRNGMNVNMPWGPLTEDLSVVERIEFVKGPAGFMLANGEPTGFYNIVTKQPTGETRGEAGLTLGSFDHYRATLDLDGKLSRNGKFLYRLNLMGQTRNAHRDFDFNNRYAIVPVLTWKLDDRTTLSAEYTHQYMKMAMLGGAYVFSPKAYGELPRHFSVLESNLEPTTIREQSLLLTFVRRLSPSWQFTARGACFDYIQQGASLWPAWPVGLTASGDLHRSMANWDAASEARLGQVYLKGSTQTRRFGHEVLAGLDMGFKSYYADFYQTALLTGYDIYGSSVPFNIYEPVHGFVPADHQPRFDRSLSLRQRGGGSLGESITGLYIQDEIRSPDGRLRLTLAGRFTRLTQHSYGTWSQDDAFTPRAGLSFSLNARNAVYALYDQAFVAQQGADSSGSPLRPVTGHSVELGYKRDWGEGRWNTTLALYRITRNNVVTYVPGPQLKPVQTGQTVTRGIEMDTRGELCRGLHLMLNYAYTDASVTKDEDEMLIGGPVPNLMYADHTAGGWISYRQPRGKLRGLGISAGGQYLAGRKESLPDYFRMDASLSWQGSSMTVRLTVNNILDEYLFAGSLFEHNNDYSSTEYNYQIEAGRNLRLGIAYRF